MLPSQRRRALLAAADHQCLLGPGLHRGGIPAGSTCWPGMQGKSVQLSEPKGLCHLAKVDGVFQAHLRRGRYHHHLLAASSSPAVQSSRLKSLANQEPLELMVHEGPSLSCQRGRSLTLLALRPFGADLLAL